jgi:hypothetical protein
MTLHQQHRNTKANQQMLILDEYVYLSHVYPVQIIFALLKFHLNLALNISGQVEHGAVFVSFMNQSKSRDDV